MMKPAIIKGVDIFNPLSDKNKFNALIQCFVEFWGEDYLDTILDYINNTTFFFVPKGIATENAKYVSERFTDAGLRASILSEKEIEVKRALERLEDILLMQDQENEKAKKEFCEKTVKEVLKLDDNLVEFVIDRKYDYFYNLFESGLSVFLDETKVSKEMCLNYIKLFKNLGVDYGLDIKKYINDPKLVALFNNPEIKKAYHKLEEENRYKMMKKHKIFSDCIEKVKSLNLTNSSLEILQGIYAFIIGEDTAGGYITSAITNDGKLQRICVCPWVLELDDEVLIHELNHIITEHLIQLFYIKSGIRCRKEKSEEKPFDEDLNKIVNGPAEYNSLDLDNRTNNECSMMTNEVVIDWFTLKIHKRFKQMAVRRFGHHTGWGSKYSRAFPFMGEFIDRYEEEFKTVLKSKELTAFADVFGTLNATRLNVSLDKFFEYLEEHSILFYDIEYQINQFMSKTNCTFVEALNRVDQSSKEEKKFVALIKQVLKAQEQIDKHFKKKNEESESV